MTHRNIREVTEKIYIELQITRLPFLEAAVKINPQRTPANRHSVQSLYLRSDLVKPS